MNEFRRFIYKSMLLGSRYVEGKMDAYVNELLDRAERDFERGHMKDFFNKCHRVEFREGQIRDFFKDSSKVLEGMLK